VEVSQAASFKGSERENQAFVNIHFCSAVHLVGKSLIVQFLSVWLPATCLLIPLCLYACLSMSVGMPAFFVPVCSSVCLSVHPSVCLLACFKYITSAL